jgi:hypothetical protein
MRKKDTEGKKENKRKRLVDRKGKEVSEKGEKEGQKV